MFIRCVVPVILALGASGCVLFHDHEADLSNQCQEADDVDRMMIFSGILACSTDCGTDQDCLTTCIADTNDISSACADCYGDLYVCAEEQCAVQCITTFTDSLCERCLRENGCQGEFEACAGVEW